MREKDLLEISPAVSNLLNVAQRNSSYSGFSGEQRSLQPQKRAKPVLVIDHIEEKPTEN